MFSSLWATIISRACRITSCQPLHETEDRTLTRDLDQRLAGLGSGSPSYGATEPQLRVPLTFSCSRLKTACSPSSEPPRGSIKYTCRRVFRKPLQAGNKASFSGGSASAAAAAACRLNPLLRLFLLNS